MIAVVIAENKGYRSARVAEIISEFPNAEILSIDDTMLSFDTLEQFLHPSLFVADAPIVHVRFFLSTNPIESMLTKKLAASPTLYVFEEFSLPTPIITLLKKEGALIHAEEKKGAKKASDDFFAVTACITAKDKKARWLAYRSAIEKQPIEALLGILYWKLRTLAAKEKKGGTYTTLYTQMLEAHARAWQTNTPLEVLIEKVILTQ